jgi:hypothetical protein
MTKADKDWVIAVLMLLLRIHDGTWAEERFEAQLKFHHLLED